MENASETSHPAHRSHIIARSLRYCRRLRRELIYSCDAHIITDEREAVYRLAIDDGRMAWVGSEPLAKTLFGNAAEHRHRHCSTEALQVPVGIDDPASRVRGAEIHPTEGVKFFPLSSMPRSAGLSTQGGTRIVAIGRQEILDIDPKAGMRALGRQIRSGAVTFELITANNRRDPRTARSLCVASGKTRTTPRLAVRHSIYQRVNGPISVSCSNPELLILCDENSPR